ncbi:AP2 domain-containing protein [Clostridium perfringens]|uniref:AP2 domain-containing protein n=1 Tax=Clostridium perfringens TaxID=1502 RepID=UPI0013E36416|nr:AP2 domain-containing protein [Clostridium perfringens]NGT85713.1 AP2 domain-containing protein [Clostridium perfringens]
MGNSKDLTGERIGMLTLVKRKREKNRTYYYCKCDCGNSKWIRADCLKTTRSCGCLSKGTQFKEKIAINEKFGRLTVVEKTNKKASNGSIIYKCKCDCGNIVECSIGLLRSGRVKSCGCLFREITSEKSKKLIMKLVEKNIINHVNVPAISRKKLLSTNTSGVTGVTWDKKREKWASQICFQNKTYNLGRYDNKEDAIKARKEAERKLFKPFLESLEE